MRTVIQGPPGYPPRYTKFRPMSDHPIHNDIIEKITFQVTEDYVHQLSTISPKGYIIVEMLLTLGIDVIR